jgi:hypothetical protein
MKSKCILIYIGSKPKEKDGNFGIEKPEYCNLKKMILIFQSFPIFSQKQRKLELRYLLFQYTLYLVVEKTVGERRRLRIMKLGFYHQHDHELRELSDLKWQCSEHKHMV